MAVTKRLRFEILRRDNHTCRYCGQSAPIVALTVDHVTPVALGGSDEPENLVAACADCNAGKSSIAPDSTLVEEAQSRALDWTAALALAAEAQAEERHTEDMQAFHDKWTGYSNAYGDTAPLFPLWEATVRRQLDGGLTLADLFDAVGVAMGASNVAIDKVFPYYCGVVKNLTKKRHNQARQIMEGTHGA